MKPNKAILFRMSEDDFNQLETLSKESKLSKNEYLRNIIRINYLVREYANGNTDLKYKNGYGFQLPEGMVENLITKMANEVVDIANNLNIKQAKVKGIVRHKKLPVKAA